MFRRIKSIFGLYEPGHEYWISIDKIRILPRFQKSTIRPSKWKRKLEYYHITGEFQSQIILHKDFTLVDGYSTYQIAKFYGLGKVPVTFCE